MLIDFIGWHCGSEDFPKKLPPIAGAHHIGMFLTWAVENRLLNKVTEASLKHTLVSVRERKMTGSTLLLGCLTGRLTTDLFISLVADFVEEYYESQYFDDYSLALGLHCTPEKVYEVEDSWENYEKVKRLLNHRWLYWQQRQFQGQPIHPAMSIESQMQRRFVNWQQAELFKEYMREPADAAKRMAQ